MKKLLILLVFFCTYNSAVRAQGVIATVFNQNQTQTQRLKEQIAALTVYINRARKAYKTIQVGLNVIGDLKKGELNLHKDYFNSLAQVSPSVKQYKKIGEILALQSAIISGARKTAKDLRQENGLQLAEVQYTDQVMKRVLENCTVVMEALWAITTDGYFEMKDDERLQRIDQLHEAMESNYQFSKSFSNEARLLVLQRQLEIKDTKTLRSLNSIKAH